MKGFEVTGTYIKNGQKQKFLKNIKADNEKMAKEYAYSLIGGKQKIRKQDISIQETKEAK